MSVKTPQEMKLRKSMVKDSTPKPPQCGWFADSSGRYIKEDTLYIQAALMCVGDNVGDTVKSVGLYLHHGITSTNRCDTASSQG